MSQVITDENVVEHKGQGTGFDAVVWFTLTIFVLCVLFFPSGVWGAFKELATRKKTSPDT